MVKQRDIQKALDVKKRIDPTQEIEERVAFIKAYLKAHPGMKTLVLGISGGQDSTLNGRLAQLAVESLRQESGDEAYRFIALRLPYGKQADEEDAALAVEFIQPDECLTINIKPAVIKTVASIEAAGVSISDFNRGNIKARERMLVQYAVAQARAGFVLGSDHAAEAVTGFYTKFGDGASDLVPLWGLNKQQGSALLRHLGAPQALLLKVPTADLEDDKPLEADEDALGVSYQAIDRYLEGGAVHPKEAEKIERLYDTSMHKRQRPVTPYDTWWQ